MEDKEVRTEADNPWQIWLPGAIDSVERETETFLTEILLPPKEFQDEISIEQKMENELKRWECSLLDEKLPDIRVDVLSPVFPSTSPSTDSGTDEPEDHVIVNPSLPENDEAVLKVSEAEEELINKEEQVRDIDQEHASTETFFLPQVVVNVTDDETRDFVEEGSQVVETSSVNMPSEPVLQMESDAEVDNHPATFTEEEKPLILLDITDRSPTPSPSESNSTVEMKVTESDSEEAPPDLEQMDKRMQLEPSLHPFSSGEELDVNDWDESFTTAHRPESESTTDEDDVAASHYRFCLPGSTSKRWYNEALPAFESRNEILRLIRNNGMSIITGSTGCGKSTHVPLFIMDEMDIRGSTSTTCNILAVLPRRIAVTNLSGYICQKRNYIRGQEIGYQVGMQSAVRSGKTKIMFVTIGVFIQRVCNVLNKSEDPSKEDPLAGYSHVIIDEVHERSEDVDFVMLLLRQAMGKTKTKIILMSATMSLEPFISYFKDDVTMLRPKHFDITRKPAQSVTVRYLDSMVSDIPVFSLDKPYFSEVIMDLVLIHIDREHQRRPNRRDQGTVLVFLPGLDQIEQMSERIKEDYGDRVPKNWEVCTLHSLLSQQVQAKVFRKLRPYVLRIVLATNIAESSITVPEVEKVYDFCLTKRMVTDKVTKMSFLQMQWASQSNCDQRKGRAGRMRDGIVCRMVPEWFFNELEKHPRPELTLVAPTTSILRLKMMGFRGDPVNQLSEDMMGPDKPDRQEVERAIFWLKEKGALSLYYQRTLRMHNGSLTFLGKICFSLPLSVSLCRLIYFAFSFGMVDDGIVLACVINARSLFSSALRYQNSGYFSKRSFDGGMKSDSLASFRAFRTWMSRVEAGEFPSLSEEGEETEKSLAEERWCHANSLSVMRLRETRIMMYEVRHRVFQLGLYNGNPDYFQNEFYGDLTWQLVMKTIIAGAFYPDFIISSPKLTVNDNAETLKEAAETNIKKFAGLDPLRTVQVSLPGQMKYLMPLFYDAQLRRWLAAVTENDMPPEILYRRNQAFVSYEPTVDDAPNSTLLSVEKLIRSNHRNAHRRKMIEVYFDAINNSCGRDLLQQLPDLQLYADMSSPDLPWMKLEKTHNKRVIPAPLFPETAFKLEFPCRPQIYITKTVDERSFYARIFEIGPDPIHEIDDLIVNITVKERCCRPPVPSEFRALVGSFVLAELATLASKYARAKVTRSCKNEGVEVFFIDYGIRSLVQYETIRLVPSFEKSCLSFWVIPALALECYVPHEYVYCGMEEGKLDIWTRFGTEHLLCNIGKRHGSGAVVFDLFTVDAVSGFHLSVYRKLQHDGVFNKNDLLLTPDISPPDNVVVVSESSLPDPEYLLNDSFGPNRYVKIQLPEQPDSPFEIQGFAGGDYRWTYPVSRMVQIQSESLNNVVIRKQKPDPVDYVFVSEEAVVTRAKNSVVALQTTMMPHIPAMAAMLSALFTPVMEVRVDAGDMKKVAGFLCGLGAKCTEQGCHPSSLYPAHDFYIGSDGLLDHDDVAAIRQLREAINTVPVEANEYILSGRTAAEENDFFELASESQADLRGLLVALFRRFRPVQISYSPEESDNFWNSAHPYQLTMPADVVKRRALSNRITYD